MNEGATYCEISRPEATYPMMSISTVDDISVIHLFRDEASCFLLNRDGVVGPSEARDFRILDIDVPFAGAFVCNAARGQSVVERFAGGTEPEELGTWTRL